MWRWDSKLRKVGFRRRGERFWLCERRHGLLGDDHLSVFSWSEQALPGGAFLVELTEFHVTFYRGGEQLHFYYHEMLDNHWQPAGHTSRTEIRRLGLDPNLLRAEADGIAEALAEALGGALLSREEEGTEGSP
jgi:hypothetical protein